VNTIYLIDYGLAKRYRESKTGAHISFKKGKGLTGTARYASINSHMGLEQSRRDDLESIGYLLVYFVKGKLPWQGIVAKDKKMKFQLIMQKKMDIPLTVLCQDLPSSLPAYL